MFKQILFITLLAVVLAKVHKAAKDPFAACLKSNCKNQLQDCLSDQQCSAIQQCLTENKGAAQRWKQREETDMKVAACLEQNDKAWALIGCASWFCQSKKSKEMLGFQPTNLIQQLVIGLN